MSIAVVDKINSILYKISSAAEYELITNFNFIRINYTDFNKIRVLVADNFLNSQAVFKSITEFVIKLLHFQLVIS